MQTLMRKSPIELQRPAVHLEDYDLTPGIEEESPSPPKGRCTEP